MTPILDSFLKTLPRLTPIATFGAAVVATLINIAVIIVIANWPWPDDAAVSRVTALMWLGLAQTLITAVVVISWAWGRPENLNISVGGQSVGLDFGPRSDDPPL